LADAAEAGVELGEGRFGAFDRPAGRARDVVDGAPPISVREERAGDRRVAAALGVGLGALVVDEELVDSHAERFDERSDEGQGVLALVAVGLEPPDRLGGRPGDHVSERLGGQPERGASLADRLGVEHVDPRRAVQAAFDERLHFLVTLWSFVTLMP
jgi:hypothetical protein